MEDVEELLFKIKSKIEKQYSFSNICTTLNNHSSIIQVDWQNFTRNNHVLTWLKTSADSTLEREKFQWVQLLRNQRKLINNNWKILVQF